MHFRLSILLLLSTSFHPSKQQNGVTLTSSVKPEGGQVEVGSYWMMKCHVKGTSNVIWYKWVGDIRTKIGYNDVIYGKKHDVISGGRFRLDAHRESDLYEYTLYLSNAQPEDSGTFECETAAKNASNIFVVCQDVGSEYCTCMRHKGWADPSCFPQRYDDMSSYYKRLLAGLGITLAVATLYVVVCVLLYGRDCIVLFHKDRMYEKEQRRERNKEGRVEFSRSRNKKTTIAALQQRGSSDQAQLTLSETVSEASSGTAGVSEDSGFAGSSQKNKQKVNQRNTRENESAGRRPDAGVNLAYSEDQDLTDVQQWSPPPNPPTVNTVSSRVNAKKKENLGVMI